MRIQPKKILCAVDFSDFTEMVVQYGKAMAKEFGGQLYLCHVVSAAYMVSSHITPYVDYTGIEAERIDQAQRNLQQLASGTDCQIVVETGSPAEMIAHIAEQHQVDMVLAATYGGSGIKRYLVGSVTDRLVKILTCPFMVLHPTDQNRQHVMDEKIKLDRILVGCDFSDDSTLAFDWALSLAQEFQTQVFLAHVIRAGEYDPGVGPEYSSLHQGDNTAWNQSELMQLDASSHEVAREKKAKHISLIEKQLLNMVPEDSQSWCSPTTVVLEGDPYQELLQYAEQKEVDLIVLGIRGHSLLEKFLVGSTTDRVIGRAGCPVLAIRQPGAKKTGKPKAQKIPEKAENGKKAITASQIMETDIISVTPETSVSDAVKLFLKHHVNGVPVLDNQGILKGILCQSDLIFQQKKISMPPIFSMLDSFIPLSSSKQLENEIEKISAITVGQAMVEDPTVVSPEASITEVASLMVENRFYTVPVVENGKLVGIIGQEDVLKQLL